MLVHNDLELIARYYDSDRRRVTRSIRRKRRGDD